MDAFGALIGGKWEAGAGAALRSSNPARPSEVVFDGREASLQQVQRAVAAARGAFAPWAGWEIERRAGALRRFATIASARVEDLTRAIQRETGKATWDARAEAQLIAAKVEITLEEGPNAGRSRVAAFEVAMAPTKVGRCEFRPHGVMAVVGPFNFPAHLPNGHIVPALLMGNTVVFKPSDKTPAVGVLLAELLELALQAEGAPPGVLNLVQGGPGVATRLVAGPTDIDGVLFTGSWSVGRRIMEANLDEPGRLLALEMGGNNAAVIMPDADLVQAVVECVRCAFISSGQRCTCTRRVLVHEAVADRVISGIVRAAKELVVGDPASQSPVFMGPVVSQAARDAVLEAQAAMAKGGAKVHLACRAVGGGTGSGTGGWYVSPGVVEVDEFTRGDDLAKAAGADVEVFGPLLRVLRVRDLDEAIAGANATRFGLAASVFTKDEAAVRAFVATVRAGCVNVNTGTAGASSKLPFGGLGLSGNHRPAGAFSLDYCAFPVAGMIETGDGKTISPGMVFEPAWIAG